MADKSLPWSTPTRQMQGMEAEKKEMKRIGARLHPRSGAGSIKDDGSDDSTIYEHKLAGKSHTIQGKAIHDLFRRSAQQGKDAVYVIEFDDYRIRIVGSVESY